MKARMITAAALLLVVASACNNASQGYGTVTFNAASAFEIAESTKSKISDYTSSVPEAGSFTLVVKDSEEKTIFEGAAKDWDSTEPLFSGAYKALLSYGEKGAEGIDCPYLSDEKSFEIIGGKNVSVALEAQLANCVVTVSLGDMLKAYYNDINISLSTGSGHEIPLSEEKAVFIEAFRFDVNGTMKTPQGKEKQFSKRYDASEIKPATHYTLKIEADGLGSSNISITFNDEVSTVDLGEITIND